MHAPKQRLTAISVLSVLLFAGVLLGRSSLSLTAATGQAAVSPPATGTMGKFVIEPQFGAVARFSDGLAAVRVGFKWGSIDKPGRVVIQPRFGWADSFSEGFAAVRIGNTETGKWGFIAR